MLGLPSRTLGRRCPRLPARDRAGVLSRSLPVPERPGRRDPRRAVRHHRARWATPDGDRAADAAREGPEPEGGRSRESGGRAAPAQRRQRIGRMSGGRIGRAGAALLVHRGRDRLRSVGGAEIGIPGRPRRRRPAEEARALIEAGQFDAALAKLGEVPGDPDALALQGVAGRGRPRRLRCRRPARRAGATRGAASRRPSSSRRS